MKEFSAKLKHFFQKPYQKVKGFFQRIIRKIASYKLTTLVIMQLKDKWNLSFKHNKRAAIFKLSGLLILFAVLTAIVYVIMYVVGTYLHIFIGYRIPLNAMIPILGILTLFEGVSILIGMTRSFFFSRDNVVLITFPVKSNTLFLSKIIVYYFDAIKKSLTLFLPVLISFGIIYNYGPGYYFLALFLDLLYMAVIVLVCGVLAIPTFFVLRFLDKYRVVKIVLALLLAGAFVYLAIAIIGIIPTNLNLMEEYDKFTKTLNNFLYNFSSTFTVLRFITHMFLGTNAGLSMTYVSSYTLFGILGMIGVIALFTVGNIYLSKPFYTKMIAASKGNKPAFKIKHQNHRSPKWCSVLKYELLRVLRNEKLIIASLICIIVMPLFTIFANRMYGAINTRPLGGHYIYVFNFLFILIVCCSHNTSASYIYSKDGPSWTVNKTMPVDPRMSLSLRMVYNFIVSLLIIIPASILFFANYKAQMYSLALFIITLIFLSTFHIVLSASYDYSHSKNKDKADIGSEIVSTHEMVSLGFGFAVCLGFFLLMLVFGLTSTVNPHTRVFLVATLLVVFEIFFFLRKVYLTYQEN